MDLQLGYNEKKFGANSFYSAKYPNQYEHTQRMIASLRGDLGGERLRLLPTIYWDREYDCFELVRGTTFGQNHHIVNNYGAGLIANYSSFLGTTTLGGELRYEEVIGNKLGTPRAKPESYYTKFGSRTNVSLSLEHTVKLDKWLISAGTLMSHNTLLSGKYTFLPSVSVNYHPLDRWSFVATWSRSMRLPTLNDLWYTDPVHKHGDNLQPEYAHSFEAIAKYQTSHVEAHLSYFLMKGSNLIDWVKFDPTETVFTSHNIAKLTNQGLEAGLALRLGEYLPFLGDAGRTKLLIDHHVAAFRSERDFNGVGQGVGALAQEFASIYVVLNIFCHDLLLIKIGVGVSAGGEAHTVPRGNELRNRFEGEAKRLGWFYSTTAKTSLCRMMSNFSPSISTSVPAYLP